ncbi:MAG: zinc-ribbon domain-containing protein [Candidatus Bathyarchaeia archaeon]
MVYCRQCGAKLDEDAAFCRVCGTPVSASAPPQAASVPERRVRTRLPLAAIVLIAVLGVAILFVAIAWVPFQNVNFYQSESAATQDVVNALNLNFDADVADVQVFLADLPNEFVVVNVSAVGSMGLFGDAAHPVQLTLSSQTAGDTLTVTSRISRPEVWPVSYNLNVRCNIYVDLSVPLNLSIGTSVGQVTMNTERAARFNALTLRAVTGRVQAMFNRGVVFDGSVSVSATTGEVQFIWNNADARGNISCHVGSVTGAVFVNVDQQSQLNGNVNLDAGTTTGDVNLAMNLQDGVATRIDSQTTTGGITVDVESFNGNQSPLYSANYPAASNFLVNLRTTTGSIHINGKYRATVQSTQEKVRDDAMTYILANHPETAMFMQNLTWTGGRQDTGLVGAETYVYESTGWTVTLKYPVVPNPVYTVTADYSVSLLPGQVGIPYRVIWQGTWENGVVKETSYVFAQ